MHHKIIAVLLLALPITILCSCSGSSDSISELDRLIDKKIMSYTCKIEETYKELQDKASLICVDNESVTYYSYDLNEKKQEYYLDKSDNKCYICNENSSSWYYCETLNGTAESIRNYPIRFAKIIDPVYFINHFDFTKESEEVKYFEDEKYQCLVLSINENQIDSPDIKIRILHDNKKIKAIIIDEAGILQVTASDFSFNNDYESIIKEIPSKIVPDAMALRLLTSSMEPALKYNEFVYISKAEPKSVAVGDIIAFYYKDAGTNNKEIMVHRVIEILEDDGTIRFKTKGDNNFSADNFLVDDLIGIVK